MTRRSYAIIGTVWVAAAAIAVFGTRQRRAVAPGTLDALESLDARGRAPASFEGTDSLPSALQGVSVEAVHDGWEGPGGRPFLVVSRTAEGSNPRVRTIGRETYPLTLRLDGAPVVGDCASCHEGQQSAGARLDAADAIHQNIQPVHPSRAETECAGCHVEGRVDRLRGDRGQETTFTHAYELCAQCHFNPVESWAKGAHGKRLVAWRGDRVVFGCAECHDPHRPATEPRAPYAGPSLPESLHSEEHGDSHGEAGTTGAAEHGGRP